MKRSEFSLLRVLLLLLCVFFVLVLLAPTRSAVTPSDMHQNNLRLIDNAMDRVMWVSNFNSRTHIRKPMVDELVDSGDIALMNWYEGCELVTADGLVPIDSDTTEAQWNDFLTNDCENGYLAVVFDGKTITTDRSIMVRQSENGRGKYDRSEETGNSELQKSSDRDPFHEEELLSARQKTISFFQRVVENHSETWGDENAVRFGRSVLGTISNATLDELRMGIGLEAHCLVGCCPPHDFVGCWFIGFDEAVERIIFNNGEDSLVVTNRSVSSHWCGNEQSSLVRGFFLTVEEYPRDNPVAWVADHGTNCSVTMVMTSGHLIGPLPISLNDETSQ